MKSEKIKASAAAMECEAKVRTNKSMEKARNKHADEWKKIVAGLYRGTVDPDYSKEGVFDSAIYFVESRRKDLESGYCNPHAFEFIGCRELAAVLSFDFNYSFDGYAWRGSSLDVKDNAAFSRDFREQGTLDRNGRKDGIVRVFLEYLKEGAAQAKRVGSDAYFLWREAMVESFSTHDCFDGGAEGKSVLALLKKVEKAVLLTWADTEIDKKMKVSPTIPLYGKKRPKKG